MLTIAGAIRRDLHRLPGVTAVYSGYREKAGRLTGDPAIVVAVEQKKAPAAIPTSQRVPAKIGGFPTDVVEATFSAAAPLEGGDGIWPEGDRLKATLGLVFLVDGKPHALTNAHCVFYPDDPARSPVGRRVWSGADYIGTVANWLDPYLCVGDAALIRIDLPGGPAAAAGLTVSAGPAGGKRTYMPARPYASTQRGREVVGVPRGVETSVLGQECWKVGQTTSYTEASVIGRDASICVQYPGAWGVILQTGQTLLRRPDNGVITLAGDSGAVWLTRTNKATALLYACDKSGARSVATDVPAVLRHLVGPDAAITFV